MNSYIIKDFSRIFEAQFHKNERTQHRHGEFGGFTEHNDIEKYDNKMSTSTFNDPFVYFQIVS